MSKKVLLFTLTVAMTTYIAAQNSMPAVQYPPAPPAPPTGTQTPPASQLPTSGTLQRLTVQDAEALALKNNPQISVSHLLSLASGQVTREAKAAYYPNVYGSLTAAQPRDDGSRIAGRMIFVGAFGFAIGSWQLSMVNFCWPL